MRKTKSIFDFKHVKGTTAVCLLNAKTNICCGRIVANWSDNPNGTVCSADVMLYTNAPIYEIAEVKAKEGTYQGSRIGTAGGYGYDKLSQAIWESLKKQGFDQYIKVYPGSGNQRNAFIDAGFVYLEVI